jgi:hypothetical protein
MTTCRRPSLLSSPISSARYRPMLKLFLAGFTSPKVSPTTYSPYKLTKNTIQFQEKYVVLFLLLLKNNTFQYDEVSACLSKLLLWAGSHMHSFQKIHIIKTDQIREDRIPPSAFQRFIIQPDLITIPSGRPY